MRTFPNERFAKITSTFRIKNHKKLKEVAALIEMALQHKRWKSFKVVISTETRHFQSLSALLLTLSCNNELLLYSITGQNGLPFLVKCWESFDQVSSTFTMRFPRKKLNLKIIPFQSMRRSEAFWKPQLLADHAVEIWSSRFVSGHHYTIICKCRHVSITFFFFWYLFCNENQSTHTVDKFCFQLVAI